MAQQLLTNVTSMQVPGETIWEGVHYSITSGSKVLTANLVAMTRTDTPNVAGARDKVDGELQSEAMAYDNVK